MLTSVTLLHFDSPDSGWSVSAAAVVVVDDKVLAIRRRDNNEWQIPGGVMELGESGFEACAREVLEETGLSVSVEVLTGVYQNVLRNIVALVFSATPLRNSHALSETDECCEIAWLTIEECQQCMSLVFFKRVEDAFSAESGSVAYSLHDGHRWLRSG